VFVVSEDTGNKTLRAFLDKKAVPELLTTIRIVRQAAEALHALHLAGLTHRAIRPENIVLQPDTNDGLLVKLQNIDFGGVAEHTTISNRFVIDSALDALRYYAPEQFAGKAANIKTDIYSLGIILYEMLAGQPPFDAPKAADLIEKHRNNAPPDIKIADFELRMLITHTLTESLQKRPEVRQSSANAFARQLRHIEQLATHVSTPPPVVAVKQTPRLVEPVIYQPPPVAAITPQKRAAAETLPQEHPELQPAIGGVLRDDVPNADHRSRLKLHRRRTHVKNPTPTSVPPATIVTSPVASRPQQQPAAKIEWDIPEEDIPTMAEVMDVRVREGIEGAVVKREAVITNDLPRVTRNFSDTAVPMAVLRFAAREHAAQMRAANAETEEVTLIRAPRKRITIHCEEEIVEPKPRAINMPEVFETVSGTGAFFSSHAVAAGDQTSRYLHFAYAGTGVIALAIAVAVWFGGLTERSTAVEAVQQEIKPAAIVAADVAMPADDDAVVLVPAENAVMQISEPVLSVPVGKQPRPEEAPVARSIPVKESTTTPDIGAVPTTADKTRVPKREGGIKAPSLSTTLVIYSDNGKIKSKTEPTDRSGATRPRIVKNPKS
jgi:hypothetical protein